MAWLKNLLVLLSLILPIFFLEYYVMVPVFVTPVWKRALPSNAPLLRKQTIYVNEEPRSRFTVIIVSFNEALLEKTVNNVLENTNPLYLKEVLIIDDLSDTPVQGWQNDTRVRIIRSKTNLGLINARRFGGNEARGEFLAFIDAHVFVSPHWLDTPHKILSEDPRTLVNYLNFNLDGENYKPRSWTTGIGSSATFTWSLDITWGGGSSKDNFSPITMGMFATSKFWWNKGQMDPGMGRWGLENIEISLRTWLCGGRIIVAKDSYVAHLFRTRFAYKVNNNDIIRNKLRVAMVWFDKESQQRFFNASKTKLKNGKPVMNYGDISERLALKKELNCKSFSWYTEFFKGRAPCGKRERCGKGNTINLKDIKNFDMKKAFYEKDW